jgi:integral membrane sensor domain MASE1
VTRRSVGHRDDYPPELTGGALVGAVVWAPASLALGALVAWALWQVPAFVWGIAGHLVVLVAGVWVTVACLVRADQR